jgi:hypothetical protein
MVKLQTPHSSTIATNEALKSSGRTGLTLPQVRAAVKVQGGFPAGIAPLSSFGNLSLIRHAAENSAALVTLFMLNEFLTTPHISCIDHQALRVAPTIHADSP